MAKKDKDGEDEKQDETSDGSIAVNDAWVGLLAVSLLALAVGTGFLAYDYFQYDDPPKDVPKLSSKPPGAGGGAPKADGGAPKADAGADKKIDEKDKDKEKEKDKNEMEKDKDKEKDKKDARLRHPQIFVCEMDSPQICSTIEIVPIYRTRPEQAVAAS